jgi:hypothetical protein
MVFILTLLSRPVIDLPSINGLVEVEQSLVNYFLCLLHKLELLDHMNDIDSKGLVDLVSTSFLVRYTENQILNI